MSVGLKGVSTGRKGGREGMGTGRKVGMEKAIWSPVKALLSPRHWDRLGLYEEEWKRVAAHFSGIYSEDFLLVSRRPPLRYLARDFAFLIMGTAKFRGACFLLICQHYLKAKNRLHHIHSQILLFVESMPGVWLGNGDAETESLSLRRFLLSGS